MISEKISAVLKFIPEIALHVSRGVRWDSDHVVTLNDELNAIAQEIVWNGLTSRVRIGLDYFDASINRIAAWAIGARNMRKALLFALLTPYKKIREAENAGDNTLRFALQEEYRTLPFGVVWDYVCASTEKCTRQEFIDSYKGYEKRTLEALTDMLPPILLNLWHTWGQVWRGTMVVYTLYRYVPRGACRGKSHKIRKPP